LKCEVRGAKYEEDEGCRGKGQEVVIMNDECRMMNDEVHEGCRWRDYSGTMASRPDGKRVFKQMSLPLPVRQAKSARLRGVRSRR
jgi:hypothetical protein